MKSINFKVWEWSLLKLSIVAFTLFFIRIWPAAMDWVHSVNAWGFFVVFVLAMIKPVMKYYK
jgi:hypothetical protein